MYTESGGMSADGPPAALGSVGGEGIDRPASGRAIGLKFEAMEPPLTGARGVRGRAAAHAFPGRRGCGRPGAGVFELGLDHEALALPEAPALSVTPGIVMLGVVTVAAPLPVAEATPPTLAEPLSLAETVMLGTVIDGTLTLTANPPETLLRAIRSSIPSTRSAKRREFINRLLCLGWMLRDASVKRCEIEPGG